MMAGRRGGQHSTPLALVGALATALSVFAPSVVRASVEPISPTPAAPIARAGPSAPGVPTAPTPRLELRLRADRVTYGLDDGSQLLDHALPVKLALEITNRGTTGVQILAFGDDRVEVGFALRGPGVIVLDLPRKQTLESHMLDPIVLGPGATYRVPILRLAYGHRGHARVYWTRPGTYTLGATLKTGYGPSPSDVKPDDLGLTGLGLAAVTLTSNDVTLKVVPKTGVTTKR